MQVFWGIRHCASKELMPQARKNRGYSHWNPTTGARFKQALDVPRLLTNRISAKRCIAQWLANPNGRHSSRQTYSGEWDDIVGTKPDGRTATDLEIVQLMVIPQVPLEE